MAHSCLAPQPARRGPGIAHSADGSRARVGDQSGLLEKEPGAGGGVLGVRGEAIRKTGARGQGPDGAPSEGMSVAEHQH